MKARIGVALFLLVLSASAGGYACFGARPSLRSYYVLYGQPDAHAEAPPREPLFAGLLRVRNLNADDVYEKFQIVVRRSPYELRYSDLNVWAVKPDNMVSDIIARALVDAGAFSSVTRELGDTRPEYTLGGELHAIEVYDSNDLWYAHLAMTLTLHRFATGERMWRMEFDQRKLVPTQSFSHAVRALSEILASAMGEAVKQLEELKAGQPATVDAPAPEPEKTPEEEQPLLVPETPR